MFPGLLGKKRDAVTIIVGGSKEESKEPSSEEVLEYCAQDLIDGVKADSAPMVAAAIRSAFNCLEMNEKEDIKAGSSDY